MLNNSIIYEDNLNSNNSIKLEKEKINKNCKDSQLICKILLFVNSKYNEDLVLKISPNIINKNIPKSKSNTNNTSSGLNKKALIIIGCVALLLIVIIVVVVIILCKFNNKNKDLAEKVNKISFQTENKDDDDEDGGETLI